MDRALRILIRSGFVRTPKAARNSESAGKDVLATLMNNLTAFGYALSREAFEALRKADDGSARAWWEEVEPILMDLTGANRKMDEHVVYKNFPHEVLAMTEADYWLRQILMYWGLPNEWFTETPLPRAPIDEPLTLRVLHAEKPDSLEDAFRALLDLPARFTDEQRTDAQYLVGRFPHLVSLPEIAFKENMVAIAVECFSRKIPVAVTIATDVLRIAAGMSDGDVSLREKKKLRRFTRRERKLLCGLLEGAAHLEDDFARRPELWKRLVHQIHPGDWRDEFPELTLACDKLYRDVLPPTSNALAEERLRLRDRRFLEEVKARPGELMRRLHHVVRVFGADGARAFIEILPRLTLLQLLKIERYVAKVNERKWRLFPPRGNWGKLQIVARDPARRIPNEIVALLLRAFSAEIKRRVEKVVPRVRLSRDVKRVKLQTSDSDLLPYGRGTVFPIPEHVRFIRTATYWAMKSASNVWFDNGWNFFDAHWKPLGACCWNATKFGAPPSAVFSGDPTNTKDSEGRACQLIDLYPDALRAEGVRYAVWNVLCYSQVSFDQAKEVFAALQWGKEPEKGARFDASRVQLAFPITGEQFTKYVAFVDVERRELTYIDANFRANVSSAAANAARLSRVMPAFVEYLDSLPSVHDVFAHVTGDAGGMPVLYDDAGVKLARGDAWIFERREQSNEFSPFALNELLNATGE